ncbi:NUDIX hydrolase [Devosia albogilva]|uniref:NUDIX hydrolase n=1 Tax=Devosia albogilva TaxID=429726 RepID=A0ABW5QHQ4_9HYPH
MSARHVLSFPIEGQRFNYRVAAVIIADGHVLVSREDDDDYVMLPGGRVEMGEVSAPALAREIEEELGMSGAVGPLLATSESFYRREGEDFHEIGLFYRASLPEHAVPDGKAPWLVREDEGHVLSNFWVPLTGGALAAMNLLPRWLPGFLESLPAEPVHIVHDERGVTAKS